MAATLHQLRHVGFTRHGANTLSVSGTKTFKELIKSGLTTRQARTYLRVKSAGSPTLNALIEGGFTKAQATLILTLL